MPKNPTSTYCPNCGHRTVPKPGTVLAQASSHNMWCKEQRPKPHPDSRLEFAGGWCTDKSVYQP